MTDVITNKVNVFTGLNTRLLDDDKDMNELLRQVFVMHGLPNVEFYTDSQLFIDSLNINVHLCIIDEKLEGSQLQGLDVMEILRSMFPEIQIVFYSGTNHPPTLKQIIKFRPEGYVDKNMPEAMHELVKVVVQCLGNIKHNMEFVVKAQEFLKS